MWGPLCEWPGQGVVVDQGSTRGIPRPSKCLELRVARVALREAAMPAILRSRISTGRPGAAALGGDAGGRLRGVAVEVRDPVLEVLFERPVEGPLQELARGRGWRRDRSGQTGSWRPDLAPAAAGAAAGGALPLSGRGA